MTTILSNPPSLVKSGKQKYLIFDAPNDDNIHLYIKEFKKHNVTHVVRACEPTYEDEALAEEGISITDIFFQDGGSPSKNSVKEWISVIDSVYGKGSGGCIGVHCVAGLGRAPLLVAIALIEQGIDPIDAVETIRKQRRGAINSNQLRWLRNYKPKKGGCLIM
eukprot:TRINITY_DN21398_c0_g1_i1.p1 TRINITY_DN21398_c0_g1~~TRINITY_DN21398_c0_g1_i1.p1  ORF type:complete len:163 (+),score=8.28 TRINITY_DN21398_c0_g1_i1:203-691(+)